MGRTHRGELFAHGLGDFLRALAGSDALSSLFILGVFIKPQAGIIAEMGRDSIVFFGLEVVNFAPALNQDGQRGRLHPADGQQHVITQGEGTAGVHAHQPIGLGAADGAFAQPFVLAVGLELGKALANGLVRHRGDPQPVHRLFALGLLINIVEDQFAFAPGVGGADQPLGIGGVDQLFDDGKLLFGLGDHLGGQGFRQHGQIGHAPFFVFFVYFIRLAQRNQMAYGPGDGVAIAGQEALA